MSIKVKHCKVELVFDIWDDEVEVEAVSRILEDLVEREGYSLQDNPKVIKVWEEEVSEDA